MSAFLVGLGIGIFATAVAMAGFLLWVAYQQQDGIDLDTKDSEHRGKGLGL